MCNFVVLFVSQETMRAMGKYVGYWGSKVTWRYDIIMIITAENTVMLAITF